MEFSTKLIIMASFIIGLVVMVLVIASFTIIPDCLKTLPTQAYECNLDVDCIFNPMFECMNKDYDFTCQADPEIVARRQAVSRKLTCVCNKGICDTIIRPD